MLVVMQEGASEPQIEKVISRLVSMGFTVHRSTGVRHTVLGGVGPMDEFDPADFEVLDGVKECHRIVSPYKLASRHFRPAGSVVKVGGVEIGATKIVMMAGPCSVENAEQIERVAERVASAGASVLRGGAFKPRTSPYSFQGLGEEGLRLMREAADRHGLLVVSEVMDVTQIPLVAEYADILQVGARNMQNFSLLRELGDRRKPVLLKRGISAIPVVKKLSHLPMIADPSHGTGRRDKVLPMARAAVAAGADGLIVEVHDDPDKALSDGAQSLFPDQFAELMEQLRIIAPAVGRTI